MLEYSIGIEAKCLQRDGLPWLSNAFGAMTIWGCNSMIFSPMGNFDGWLMPPYKILSRIWSTPFSRRHFKKFLYCCVANSTLQSLPRKNRIILRSPTTSGYGGVTAISLLSLCFISSNAALSAERHLLLLFIFKTPSGRQQNFQIPIEPLINFVTALRN